MAFDPRAYPRTYRMSRGWRVTCITIGVVMLGLATGAGVLGWHEAGAGGSTGSGPGVWIFCGAFFVAFGVYMLACVPVAKLVLTADAITVTDLLAGTRSLRRSEIAGFRERSSGFFLIPVDDRLKKLSVDTMYESDEALDPWFEGIKNLDAAEYEQSEQALMAEEQASEPSGPEPVGLGRARARDRIAGVAFALVCLAVIIVGTAPGPLLALLIVLPWGVVWLTSRRPVRYRLVSSRTDARIDLSAYLMMPGFALLFTSMRDVHFVTLDAVTMWAVIATAALGVAAARADPQLMKGRVNAVFTVLFLLAYGLGATSTIDAHLDESKPRIFHAVVMKKSVSKGRSHTPFMTLAPWGPVLKAEEHSVTWNAYTGVRVGDTACVSLHRGALRMQWFAVVACAERVAPPPAPE